MEDLKAQPDQLLTYYFWADDVGPDGQPAPDRQRHLLRRGPAVRGDLPREPVVPERPGSAAPGAAEPARRAVGTPAGDQLAQVCKSRSSPRRGTSSSRPTLRQDHRAQGRSGCRPPVPAGCPGAGPTGPDASRGPGVREVAASRRRAHADFAGSSDRIDAVGRRRTTDARPGAEQSAYQELLKLRQREYQVARSRAIRTEPTTTPPSSSNNCSSWS